VPRDCTTDRKTLAERGKPDNLISEVLRASIVESSEAERFGCTSERFIRIMASELASSVGVRLPFGLTLDTSQSRD
jgi:hypothetical protein